jgi:hypothetical protein
MNFAEKSEKNIRKTHFLSKQSATEKSLFLNKSRKSLSSRSISERFNEHESSFNERHHEFNELVSSSSSLLIQSRSLSFDRFSRQSDQSKLKNFAMNQSIRPDSIKRESDFERELSTLTKLYTNEAKYSDENDNFSFKLIIFHDMCDRANIPHSIKLKIFFTMLKELTLDYYYENMITSITQSTFDEVCFQMKSYFEDAEYKKSLLFK